jgi:hypothetical protein
MKQFYVYFHCKPDGTPFYVGKGCGPRYKISPSLRAYNKHHQHIVEKYGKENIKIEIQLCADEQEAFEQEILSIQSLREGGIQLCNFTDGGDGVSGYRHTEEAKEKNRQAHLGKISIMHSRKASAEAVEKNRLGHLGKKPTPASNAKRSATMKGKAPTKKCLLASKSIECNAKRSAVLKGKPWSAARREAENNRR